MKKKENDILGGSHMKTGFIAAAFLLIIGAVFLSFRMSPEKAVAAPDSTLYFDPSPTTAGVGEDFTLDAKINPGSNRITAVELHVTFNPIKFRLDSVTKGSAFGVVFQNTINNADGTATVVVGVPAATPLVPVTSISTVATFSFHSLATVDASPITFANGTMAAAEGEGSTDVLTSKTAGAVTVAGTTYENSDFANLAADWLKTGASPADINADSIVDTRDLGIMMSGWQQ